MGKWVKRQIERVAKGLDARFEIRGKAARAYLGVLKVEMETANQAEGKL